MEIIITKSNMQDTNIVIRVAVEGYIVTVNRPSQNLLDAAANEPHIFLSLADVNTFLTTTVLVDSVEAAPVDAPEVPADAPVEDTPVNQPA